MSKRPVRMLRGGRSLHARAENRLRNMARATKRKRATHDFLRAVQGPTPVPTEASPRIAILLCKSDFYMANIAMKAYVLANGHAIRFHIHEDGTLGPSEVGALREDFPGSVIVTRAEADARAARALADYPHVRAWRLAFNIALKAVDIPLFWEGTHVRLIDSDVLAHTPCTAFLEPRDLGESVFNADAETAYVASVAELRDAYGVSLPGRVNSGTFAVPLPAFDHAYMERVLASEPWARWVPNRWHFQEQTMVAMCAAVYGQISFLPSGYDVTHERAFADTTQKHYIRTIRHGFELEGLNYLLSHTDVAGRWASLTAGA